MTNSHPFLGRKDGAADPAARTHTRRYLFLSSNRFGDAGMTGLSRAIRSGSLDKLETLTFSLNKVGDPGMVEFSEAVAGGSLPKLERLYLDRNRVGSVGVSSLADACSKGAMPALDTLGVDLGALGTEFPALKAVCEGRRIAMVVRTVLFMDS